MAMTMRYPDYLDDYSCKCGACRRTCCTGRDWDISMDRSEYEAVWAELNAGEGFAMLAPRFAGAVEGGDGRVSLPMTEGGRCALLESDGRCAWRKNTGHDACAICREFPVMYVRLFDDVYACPSGACEAVLEALLRKPGRIELRSRPLANGEGPYSYQLDVAEGDVPADSVYGAYSALIDLALDVLQDGRYDLDRRMAVLVSCLNVVDKMVQIGQDARLGAAVASMRDDRRVAALVEGFGRDGRTGNPAMRICPELYRCCLDSTAYAPIARRVLDNLGFAVVSHNGQARAKVVLRQPDLLEERRGRCRSYLDEKADFLAKVMAGVFLHSGVPLAGPDPWSNARYFAVCYCLIKFGIAGYFDDVPTDEGLVDFLVLALRAFTHNGTFYRSALRWLDGLKFTDVNDVAKTVLW